MVSSKEFNQNLESLLTNPDFIRSQSQANELLDSMKKSSKFNFDSILIKTQNFFSTLKSNSPSFYELLKTTEKEIYQLAFEKRTGSKAIFD